MINFQLCVYVFICLILFFSILALDELVNIIIRIIINLKNKIERL